MRIENGYLYLESPKPLKRKKITGSNISAFAGIDKFNLPGDAFLSRHGFYKEKFDSFYTKRGDIAEKLAVKYFDKQGFKSFRYNSKSVEYDLFRDNDNFGGVIDIDLYKDGSYISLVELKSKNVKDYEEIKKYGNQVQEEQGLHYGWLKGLPYIYMIWVFFDDKTEFEIRNNLKITTFKNCNVIVKKIDIDYAKEKELHEKSLKFYNECLINDRVPLNAISEKVMAKIKPMIKE